MTLREVIDQYILWREAHGAKFTTGANLLRHFLRYADGDATCDVVTTTQVLAFLSGKGALTRCSITSRSVMPAPPDREPPPREEPRD